MSSLIKKTDVAAVKCGKKSGSSVLSGNVFDTILFFLCVSSQDILTIVQRQGTAEEAAQENQKQLPPLPSTASKPRESTLSNLFIFIRCSGTSGGRREKNVYRLFYVFKSTRSTTQSVFPKLQRATIILSLSSSCKVIKASPQALQMKNPRVKA